MTFKHLLLKWRVFNSASEKFRTKLKWTLTDVFLLESGMDFSLAIRLIELDQGKQLESYAGHMT